MAFHLPNDGQDMKQIGLVRQAHLAEMADCLHRCLFLAGLAGLGRWARLIRHGWHCGHILSLPFLI